MTSKQNIVENELRKSYSQDGLIKAPFKLPEIVIERMLESLEKLLFDNPDIPPESLICPHIPYGVNHNHEAAKTWFEYVTNPEVLDLVELLIGPNIVLWGSQVFCKPSSVGKGVPWHQDGHYWPISPLATCSVWIALDSANLENGCMRYIRGSHHLNKVLPHTTSHLGDVVLSEEVSIKSKDTVHIKNNNLERGEFSLHDVYLIHGSNPNKSKERRAGFVIRYMPSSSMFKREKVTKSQSGVKFDMSERPIWLLRGVDQSGSNDYKVGHNKNYLIRR